MMDTNSQNCTGLKINTTLHTCNTMTGLKINTTLKVIASLSLHQSLYLEIVFK